MNVCCWALGSEISPYSRWPWTVTVAVVDVGPGVGGRDRMAVEQHPQLARRVAGRGQDQVDVRGLEAAGDRGPG